MKSVGFIKLFRSVIQQTLSKRPYHLVVYCHLYALARFEDCDYNIAGLPEPINLLRGQTITSYKGLSSLSGISYRTLKTVVTDLADIGLIELKPWKQFLIVTFKHLDEEPIDILQPPIAKSHRGTKNTDCKMSQGGVTIVTVPYDKKQSPLCKMSQAPMTIVTHKKTDSECIKTDSECIKTVPTTFELPIELPKVEITKAVIIGQEKRKATQDDLNALPSDVVELARDWCRFAKEMAHWLDFSLQTGYDYSKAIMKVMKAKDLNITGMRAVLNFVRNDDFWSKNALSPMQLLKKKTGKDLCKIDYILLNMQNTKSIKDARTIQEIRNFDEKLKDMGRTTPLTHDELTRLAVFGKI